MSSNKNISLLSYNVFLRPPPIKTNEDDYKQERFEKILKEIQRYDIVCLQEMFQTGSFRSEKIIEFAIQNGFYYWKISTPPNFLLGPVVDSGLLVLSKYPIISSQFRSYDIGILSDSASDKGYIYCKINAKNSIIHLFATHLQASYMFPGMDLERELSVKVRLKQCQILIQRIKALLKENSYNPKDLVMVVGDFNINPKQEPFKLKADSHLRSNNRSSSQKDSLDSHREPLNLNESKTDYFSEFRYFQNLFTSNQIVLIDHLFERYKEHKPTFGDNEKILTDETQSQSYQRLDFVFTLVPTYLTQKIEETKLRAKTSTCTVQQFKRPQEKYGQLSDHYGISIQFQ